jgi:drug/metabolite transporter (DMT)-like permease
MQVPGGQLSPGSTYVVSVFNNDYVTSTPFIYSLTFYVMAEGSSYLHPYMSILLGVTAAVILCLAMTLCKRVVVRYGFVPWRWRQRRRQLLQAAAGGGVGGQQNSLALVLMAQGQPASRGVPPEIYNTFPSRCVGFRGGWMVWVGLRGVRLQRRPRVVAGGSCVPTAWRRWVKVAAQDRGCVLTV